jgi:hypothetical protein
MKTKSNFYYLGAVFSYLVAFSQGLHQNYYAGNERIASKIGSIFIK